MRLILCNIKRTACAQSWSRLHVVIGEEVIFYKHQEGTPQVGLEAEVQIEKEHNKPWLLSRSPGLSVLSCAHCVSFNYIEWDFVQFHTSTNMQQLFLISVNDSLNFKCVCSCVWASMHVGFCLCDNNVALCHQPLMDYSHSNLTASLKITDHVSLVFWHCCVLEHSVCVSLCLHL